MRDPAIERGFFCLAWRSIGPDPTRAPRSPRPGWPYVDKGQASPASPWRGWAVTVTALTGRGMVIRREGQVVGGGKPGPCALARCCACAPNAMTLVFSGATSNPNWPRRCYSSMRNRWAPAQRRDRATAWGGLLNAWAPMDPIPSMRGETGAIRSPGKPNACCPLSPKAVTYRPRFQWGQQGTTWTNNTHPHSHTRKTPKPSAPCLPSFWRVPGSTRLARITWSCWTSPPACAISRPSTPCCYRCRSPG